jgi:exo-beta-1,3-glucanase (GH17 family)
MKQGFVACAVLSLLGFFLWGTPNQPQAADVTMPATKFNSLSYAPFQAWQSPNSLNCPEPPPGQPLVCQGGPTAAEVAKDLKLIATRANGIRTYSAIEGNFDIGALARQAGLKIWLGIWLSSNPRDNAREMAAGIAEANKYPDVVTRVVVGNEVLLRRDLSVDDLIADIDQVKAQVKQPVAYADVTDFWTEFGKQLAPHVDIVMIHFLPYWENKPLDVDTSIATIKSTIDQFKTAFPGKPISIGETGWPSRGRWRGPAAPSRVNEAVFLREFVTLAGQEHVDYNLIEAFDQPWKYEDEGVAGANWGIWNAERVQKFPLNGGVVEHPDWPWYAIIGAIAGSLLFASTGFRNVRLAVPSFALGNAFAIACAGTLPMLYDNWLVLDAVVNLPLQALFSFIAIRRADSILAGQKPPPATTAAQTLAALRRGKPILNYDSLSFLFLVSAAIFQAMLVFDGRYRDAPMAVFIIPVIAAVFRFWTKDKPTKLGWEDILSANALAIGAIASAVLEGPENLDFVTWNLAALVLAAPVLMAQNPKRRRVGVRK